MTGGPQRITRQLLIEWTDDNGVIRIPAGEWVLPTALGFLEGIVEGAGLGETSILSDLGLQILNVVER